jgi:hypothetical protein
MEIPATLFFEMNVEGLSVKSAAGIYIADDRPKTRDEENSDSFQSLHGVSSSYGEGCSHSRHPGYEFSSRHASNDSPQGTITS